MKFLNNIKIRTKLLGSFLIVVLFTIVMGAIGIYDLNKVDKSYTETITTGKINLANRFDSFDTFSTMRRMNRDLIIYADNSQQLSTTMNSITAAYNELQKILDNSASDTTINTNQVKKDLDSYYSVCKDVHEKIAAGDLNGAKSDLEGTGAQLANSINTALLNSYQAVSDLQESKSTENSEATRQTILLMVILTLLTLVVSITLALLMASNIVKPVYTLMNAAKEIAAGNLNVRLGSNYRDELSILSNDLAVVVDNIRTLIDDLARLTMEIDGKGDIDARLTADKFQGAYKEVVVGVNTLVGGIVNDSLELIGFIKSYALGDFSATVKQHVGKKAVINEGADLLANNLTNLSSQINTLLESALVGDLDTRIDISRFGNDWKKIVKGLNDLLEGVVVPVKETISVLEALSKGQLNATVEGNYKGAYLNMKNATNNTILILAKYINEIASVLNEMASQNFDLEIKNDYIGDFAPIKVALNKIIDNLNYVLDDINTSAEQVASGARLISESSQSLAMGATEQAGAVEQLRFTLETISDQTRKNASDAKNADKLAIKAKEDADSGNNEMKGMLKAMEEINNASSNISKIIKVIDDIAFQTNLLALNAAVEAARAGQHGKGFAVVAEEVRSLAGRSKNAAQETTGLIQGTVAKVSEGTTIANQTAQALESIVHEITDISSLISGVAEASEKQEAAIQLINTSIGQIAEVTQTNSATSEEEASSSEELSSQAEVFKQTVSSFKLRKSSGRVASSQREPAEVSFVSEYSVKPSSKPVMDDTPRQLPKTPPAVKNMYSQSATTASVVKNISPQPVKAVSEVKRAPLQTTRPASAMKSALTQPVPKASTVKSTPPQPAPKTSAARSTPPQLRPTKSFKVDNRNMPGMDYNRKDFGKY